MSELPEFIGSRSSRRCDAGAVPGIEAAPEGIGVAEGLAARGVDVVRAERFAQAQDNLEARVNLTTELKRPEFVRQLVGNHAGL